MSGEDILISCRVMGQSKGPSQECVWPVQEIGETEGWLDGGSGMGGVEVVQVRVDHSGSNRNSEHIL